MKYSGGKGCFSAGSAMELMCVSVGVIASLDCGFLLIVDFSDGFSFALEVLKSVRCCRCPVSVLKYYKYMNVACSSKAPQGVISGLCSHLILLNNFSDFLHTSNINF